MALLVAAGAIGLAGLSGLSLPSYTTSRAVLVPPDAQHWLGTNEIGQDVATGLLVATPTTVLIAVLVASLSLVLSLVYAVLATITPPWLQSGAMRGVDVMQIMPSILIILLVAAWIQPGLVGVILLLALTSWPDDVRVLRSVMLREMRRENVAFARSLGASWPRCVLVHIVPSMRPVLLGVLLQQIREAALRTAGLGFLGLTDPRLVTWGSMMQDALDHLHSPAWSWLLLPPAACLSLFLVLVIMGGRRLDRPADAMAT
jgi:peptide/nickel transport system permease protein